VSPLEQHIIVDSAEVELLRDPWSRLADSEGHNLYATYEWSSALWESHFDCRGVEFHVLRNHAELRGVIPLIRRRTQKLGIPLATLGLLTNSYGRNHNDLILAGDRKEAFLDLLEGLRPNPWDILILGSFTAGETRTMVDALQQQGRFRVIAEPYVDSPYLTLSGDWQSFLAERSGNFRSDLKRKEKRAAAAKMKIRILKEPEEVSEALNAMYAIEKQSWKEGSGTSITTQAHSQRFYDVFLPKAAARGWLHCVLLELGGMPAAFDMGILHGGKYYMLKTSYAQAWQDVSPGFVLRARVIEQLYGMGVSEHDFLGDPEPWKLRWTGELRKHWNLYLYNTRRPAANLYSAAVNILRSQHSRTAHGPSQTKS